jgi:hypothetical protein
MQALSDEQQLERLEKTVYDGFAETKSEFADVRSEFRAVRAEIGGLTRTVLTMWLTMILGFAGLIIAILTHT